MTGKELGQAISSCHSLQVKPLFLLPLPFLLTEDDEDKKLLAEKLLQGIISELTKDDADKEEDYGPSYEGEEGEIDEEEQSSSVLDAGMVDEESMYEAEDDEKEGVFLKEVRFVHGNVLILFCLLLCYFNAVK